MSEFLNADTTNQSSVVSELFLELRDDLIGHIGATAIEVKRK